VTRPPHFDRQPCPLCAALADRHPGGVHFCPSCRIVFVTPLATTSRPALDSPDIAAQNLTPGAVNSRGSDGSKFVLGTGEACQRFQENRHDDCAQKL
jgi:hypothetical protein